MQEHRLLNLPESRQTELRRQFPWLKAVVYDEERPSNLKVLSLTVFDHWLSRDEACELLEGVSPEEQEARDARHANFCALVATETPVLSFAFRRRAHDRTVFREFKSREALVKYFTPYAASTLGHRQFHVVLPELGCAFFESWDDTHHFFFTDPIATNPIQGWAQQCGLFLLTHG